MRGQRSVMEAVVAGALESEGSCASSVVPLASWVPHLGPGQAHCTPSAGCLPTLVQGTDPRAPPARPQGSAPASHVKQVALHSASRRNAAYF